MNRQDAPVRQEGRRKVVRSPNGERTLLASRKGVWERGEIRLGLKSLLPTKIAPNS
jgi:hypothetical protein